MPKNSTEESILKANYLYSDSQRINNKLMVIDSDIKRIEKRIEKDKERILELKMRRDKVEIIAYRLSTKIIEIENYG